MKLLSKHSGVVGTHVVLEKVRFVTYNNSCHIFGTRNFVRTQLLFNVIPFCTTHTHTHTQTHTHNFINMLLSPIN